MAPPRACSEPCSADPARRSSSSSVSAVATTSVTRGTPRVSVPVLSSTTAVVLWANSNASALRMRTPNSAPLPVPTMIAVGVANPRAQGHAMMTTATNVSSEYTSAGSGPMMLHSTKLMDATAMTTGTKYDATTSTRRWMGAFDPWASSTSRMIWARTVSPPTLVARNVKPPVWFSVAAKTWEPTAFSTGRLSPVSIDSSMLDVPSSTTPSTATFSPGRTSTASPGDTSPRGTSRQAPSRSTRAVLACSPISRRMASEVSPFARASRYLPSRIRPMMMLDVSKYTCGSIPRAANAPGSSVTPTLKK